MKRWYRAVLAATTSVVSLGAIVGTAWAGGLVNSSQSSVFNGLAYAGFAAPGSSSPATMFLNPATLTGFNRIMLDSSYSVGVPITKINGAYNVPALNGLPGSSRDIGLDYIVPASYIVYPLNDRIVFGLSINTTYGNSTKAPALWRGSYLAETSKLRVITGTPSVAYKINDWISVGVGLQVQYATARQFQAIPPLGATSAGLIDADGFGFGWTAGVTLTPTKTTQIGIGWRSFVDQDLNGTTFIGALRDPNANGTLNLPNRVNVSLRQTFTPEFDLLASVEWQNFGRIGNAAVNTTIPNLRVLPFGYRDGWFFSVGGEYKWNDQLTLRAGIGYEITPINDPVRRVSLPDNDRLWLSTGLSYNIFEKYTVNASYSFLHIKEGNIVQALNTVPGAVFTGRSKSSAHLISLGLTSRWGDPPKREEPLVKKF